jgi:glycosyltransferase involved in cell wall biosynthesis
MKSSDTPETSLIVIAYREAARIEATLRAILNQAGAPAFEVVVVDDGSPDATGDIVAALAVGEPRLRLLRLPKNVGRGLARAAGVAAARGQSIGFVDADTTLPPDWLTRCVAALPGHAAVGGTAVPDGDVAVVTRITGVSVRPLRHSRAVTGSNVLFDGDVLRATRFPKTPLGEDFRLVTTLQRSGHRLATIPGLFVKHDERKSYRNAAIFMFRSGIDANRLLAEFRELRSPDAAGLAFSIALAVSVVAAAAGFVSALLLPLSIMLGTWVGHVLTRFRIFPSPLRFVFAALLDLPVIAAYLTGRLIGIPLLARRPK